MEDLQGSDLLTIIGQKPWFVFSSGRLTGEVHARINAARAPASLPAVMEVASRGLARLAGSEPALAEWVGRVLAHLPDGDALCHGDFHPGQLMFSGDQCAAFDWSGPSAETLSSTTDEREYCSVLESLRLAPSSR